MSINNRRDNVDYILSIMDFNFNMKYEDEVLHNSKKDHYKNFIIFCTCFSVLHGTVDGILAYTVPLLGANFGGIGSGILYTTYALSSLLVSDACVTLCGSRKGVLIGMFLMLLYVAAFCFSVFFYDDKVYIFPLGAALGGIGGSIIWTAQGAYYVKNALIYAHASADESTSNSASKSEPTEPELETETTTINSIHLVSNKVDLSEQIVNANTLFASIFSSFYLGFETVITGFATLIYVLFSGNNDDDGHSTPVWVYIVFGVYGTSCLLSYLGAFKIRSYHDSISVPTCTTEITPLHSSSSNNRGDNDCENHRDSLPLETDATPRGIWNRLMEVYLSLAVMMNYSYVHLIKGYMVLKNSHRILGLMPYQLVFGFATSYFVYYVLGHIIGNSDEKRAYIGLISGVVTLIASLIAYPINYICQKYTKSSKIHIVIFGNSCFLVNLLLLLLLPVNINSQWGMIILQVILHGFGRGIWENTNKAIVADIVQLSPKLLDTIQESSISNHSLGKSNINDDTILLASDNNVSDNQSSSNANTLSDMNRNNMVSNDDIISAVYANICFFSGLGGAVGYFCYPFLSSIASQLLIACICVLSLVSIAANYTNYVK